MNDKKRMSNKKFVLIVAPIIAVLLAVLIVGNMLLYAYQDVMKSQFFGYGKVNVSGNSELYNYYENPYEDAEDPNREAMLEAQKTAKRVADEGIVLLRNEGLLPLAKGSKVTPFGYRYLWPCYSQFGSTTMYGGFGAVAFADLMNRKGPEQELDGDHVIKLDAALASKFNVNSASVEAMQNAEVHRIDAAEGTIPCQEVSPQNCNGGNTYLYEYEASVYEPIAASCADTVGLVFIGRDAGEGGDLKLDGYADGTRHQLALSKDEKDTIAFAKANCSQGVVAVINSNNLLELGELVSGPYAVDAIVWVGTPGSAGFQSFSDILCGEVVPSGRTVSSWLYDNTKDPTYANMFSARYNNVQCRDSAENAALQYVPYIEYEEGIYVDYKFYETAIVEDDTFNFDETVLYPFGYGLSYVDKDGGFQKEISNFQQDGDTVTIEVTVTNNSATYTGKDVVEFYYTAPYTDFDEQYGIEKAVVNLLGFKKTDEIAPGKSDKVTFTFAVEDMASYCSTKQNSDGTEGCYVLEEGDYDISVRDNSHIVADRRSINVEETIWYDNTNPRQSEIDGQSELDDNGVPTGKRGDGKEFVAATNEFADMTKYMEENTVQLTRSDWENTFPTRAEESKAAPQYVVDDINAYSYGSYDYASDPYLGNVPGSMVYNDVAPVANAGNDIDILDMRGVNYDDEKWDRLLDNLDYSSAGLDQLWRVFFSGSYSVNKIESIGFNATASMMEGPAGIGAFSRFGLDKDDVACTYPSGMMQASTWNMPLLYELGVATAREYMNIKEEGVVNGWTGPSMNSQRSPFSGRNGEYYSVDPVLSGYAGKSVIEGASDAGMFCMFKHFAMNDEEVNRHSICVWANEQTVREQYLKTFEIVMKEGRKTVKYYDEETETIQTKVMKASMSTMTTMTRMGAVPAGGHYGMQTRVVRGEWGFKGFIITDMPTQTDSDLLLRSGGDIQLSTQFYPAADKASNTMKNLVRESVHHIMYAVVNSNYMNGKGPGVTVTQGMSGYDVLVILFNTVIAVVIVGLGAWLCLRLIDGKRNPDKYRKAAEKADKSDMINEEPKE